MANSKILRSKNSDEKKVQFKRVQDSFFLGFALALCVVDQTSNV